MDAEREGRRTSMFKSRWHWRLAFAIVAVLFVMGFAAVRTNTLGAGDRLDRMMARIEGIIDPAPRRPTLPTIVVTPEPTASQTPLPTPEPVGDSADRPCHANRHADATAASRPGRHDDRARPPGGLLLAADREALRGGRHADGAQPSWAWAIHRPSSRTSSKAASVSGRRGTTATTVAGDLPPSPRRWPTTAPRATRCAPTRCAARPCGTRPRP